MRYSNLIGIVSGIILIIATFLPWTYHPDLHKIFTGFFSEHNSYGKPGKFLIFLTAVAQLFFIIPRVWAKRWNLLVCALVLSYAIKSFILFSGCYHGICPEKKAGLWLMLASAIILMIMAALPELDIGEKRKTP